MIDAHAEHLQLTIAIVKREVPDAVIRAFGSRVRGDAKPTSDLDIAIQATRPLSLAAVGRLKEAFEESDLPFQVDFVDWHCLDASFRALIERTSLEVA